MVLELSTGAADIRHEALVEENRMLRDEIRVSREAADITTKLVVEQFEKTEAILTRLEVAKDEMAKANEEQEAILEASSFGIAFIKNRIVLKVNRRFEELFGYDMGELRGQTTRLWYPDEESYLSVGESYSELARGEIHRRFMKMAHKDGTAFWCRLNGRAISSSDMSRGSVWTVEDVTAEYNATEALSRAKEVAEDAQIKLSENYMELEEANQRLQKLDQLKSDFLSSVSHELRTPLTSIRGFAHLVDREFSRSFAPLAEGDAGLIKKSSRIQENLEILLKESDRLTRLINDVLDLAKIESGRVEWRDTPIQLALLAHDAVKAVRGLYEQKPSVQLKIEIQDGMPIYIGDADRLLQVLVNLLNNAAKFTECGTVMLRVFLNPQNLSQIDVIDSGIGFPPEEAEAIFDKFQQAQHGDTLKDRPKGTGLGLAISREIIERHKGKISARSEPGKGSVFSILLPPATERLMVSGEVKSNAELGVDESMHTATDIDAPLGNDKRQRVLVVDDDAGIRDYLSQLLQERGYDVRVAADGQEAIVVAHEFRPSLITMDLAMPVMDGRSTIAKLRADPELQQIPIMVVSAIAGLETAGGDVAMTKPLDEARLLMNVDMLLGKSEITERKKMRFLVLYETERDSMMEQSEFGSFCEVDYCRHDELLEIIRSGFQGMLAIPVSLLDKIDLHMLKEIPSLEVMIMPMRVSAPKT